MLETDPIVPVKHVDAVTNPLVLAGAVLISRVMKAYTSSDRKYTYLQVVNLSPFSAFLSNVWLQIGTSDKAQLVVLSESLPRC